MKESKEIVTRKVVKDTGLFVQFVLSALLLVFVIIWAFIRSNIIEGLVNLILGLVFLVMGYNNYRVYKRKAFTAIYLIIGIYFLITSIIGIF